MFCSFPASLLSVLLDLLTLRLKSDQAKDLELLLRRYQVRILRRKQTSRLRIATGEKLALAIVTAKLRSVTDSTRTRLDHVLVVFTPTTVLKWHRELVRRTWTFTRQRGGGRPVIPADLEAVILRLALENPT